MTTQPPHPDVIQLHWTPPWLIKTDCRPTPMSIASQIAIFRWWKKETNRFCFRVKKNKIQPTAFHLQLDHYYTCCPPWLEMLDVNSSFSICTMRCVKTNLALCGQWTNSWYGSHHPVTAPTAELYLFSIIQYKASWHGAMVSLVHYGQWSQFIGQMLAVR